MTKTALPKATGGRPFEMGTTLPVDGWNQRREAIMRTLTGFFIAITAVLFLAGCPKGDGGTGGGTATGGGKAFNAAMNACTRLGIVVRSSREGQIINGVLPESTEEGEVIVNMTFRGNKVDIEFYNAPESRGWQASWKNKIVRAIEQAGSK
ncbi:MAG: hypothetical protein JW909_04880 [Planctomycetes bacterium]|nr:hypothetical protein [Planctomycetota bacterium]